MTAPPLLTPPLPSAPDPAPRERPPRRHWEYFRAAAVSRQHGAGEDPHDGSARPGRIRLRAAAGWGLARHARFPESRAEPSRDDGRRTDLRLVIPAVMVWGTALAGSMLAPAAIAALCVVLLAGAGILGYSALRLERPGHGSASAAPRRLRITVAVGLLLAAAAGAHASAAAAQRHHGPLADAAAGRGAVVVEVEVAGTPARLAGGIPAAARNRWRVPVQLLALHSEGQRFAADARLLVMGGPEWQWPVPGQQLRTTGKLAPAGPGRAEAAVLAATSAPLTLRGPPPWQRGPGELRQQFAAAAGRLDADSRGLLPGMVTGDTSALAPGLDQAMKSVGLTHLTAVSGANCSLIMGTLLLAARAARMSRGMAVAACLAGLVFFMLLVGPEPSVLRAGVMGAIALTAVAGGRPGRGLSTLCVAAIVLLLADPALATSFGFGLSVSATLGIVLMFGRITGWIPAPVPRVVAGGLALPLAAQLFCGPAVVLLEPRLTTYALPANVAAAVLVGPVTLLGTAAVPLVGVAPGAADFLMAGAAFFAAGVAGVARFFAALPGSTLPWPAGALGCASMVLFSALGAGLLWLALHPGRAVSGARFAHARTLARLERC